MCAGALSSRCARAALGLRSRCARAALHTPASGEPEPWAVHDDGGSSPSSSLPSCCHRAVIIHANSLARALALARVLSLARDDALATLALRSHSRPCLVALKRCARLAAPPLARAALSLASRAPSPHPRPSLPRSSAATSARLRCVLRSISSPPCFIHTPHRCKTTGTTTHQLAFTGTYQPSTARRRGPSATSQSPSHSNGASPQ